MLSAVRSFFRNYMPAVQADDELVDPQKVLREQCSKETKCTALREKLDTCNSRVRSRTMTAETCAEELIDYVECVDHCVAKDLFSKLK